MFPRKAALSAWVSDVQNSRVQSVLLFPLMESRFDSKLNIISETKPS